MNEELLALADGAVARLIQIVPDRVDLARHGNKHACVLVLDADFEGLEVRHECCVYIQTARKTQALWAALSLPNQIRRLRLQAAARPTDLDGASRALW